MFSFRRDLLSSSYAHPGRLVVDQTEDPGRYDFELHWAASADSTEPGPSLPTALEEQAGLIPVPTHAPVDFAVIDHAEAPSAN